MGAGGGIGQAAGGMVEMFTAMDEKKADDEASQRQFQREQAQANAAIEGAIEKGAFESGKQRILGAQLSAKQKMAYGSSGVDPTSGTAAQVQSNTAALSELDAQTLSINAAREAWGFKEQSKQVKQESEARNANIDRKYKAALLGGFTKYASGVLSSGGG